jgi:phosphoadenosine phosphosulfate reductase
MGKDRARQLSLEWSSEAPATVLRRAAETFGAGDVAFATSLGAEDQVITDLLHKEGLPVPVFTLDTGRLPEETYEALDATRRRYDLHVDVLFPQTQAVETMLSLNGANLFYESIEKRKECCRIRKVEPLSRKLSTVKAWICGLRREQSVTRQGLDLVEWDESFGLFKINPLADASEAWVWEYIRSNDVPYNRLHDRGYPSIGCAPCTRAVQPGEDIRSGRWWWESPEHKECGLHRRPV